MTGVKIKKIAAQEILDSRGLPTVAVTVTLSDGATGTASVPSGTSSGRHEARELRDGDARYAGLGVRRAVANVNGTIAANVVGRPACDQRALDQRIVALDGSLGKVKLGANAILGVSLAVSRAAAASQGVPLYRYLRQLCFGALGGWRLPSPMCNLINGGAHGGWNLDVQEFMVLPQQTRCAEQIRCAAEVFQHLKILLERRGLPITVGYEGGFAPRLATNQAALQLLARAVGAAGYRLGVDVKFGLDLAASEFFSRGKYRMRREGKNLTADAMTALLKRWMNRYPIVTVEDPLAEDDWPGWQALTRELSGRMTVIGDDLFTTNALRLRRGFRRQAANAILIKPNQIGTLTETVDTMELARTHGYRVCVSHRSGETTDDFIVDLAVAGAADYLKAGSMSRGERVSKWNRLMAIALAVNQ